MRKNIFQLGQDCPWALRRLKEDLRDLHGRRLFPDRHAQTVTFCLNSEEYTLYKTVTAYINEFLPQQTGQRRSSAALARTVFQRRLASSTRAIHESLKRRLQKQQELLERLENMTPAQRARWLASLQGRLPDVEQDEDDLDEAARDLLVDEYTVALELDQLKREVVVLRDLVEQARRVREQSSDSKLATLKKCLSEAQFSELKDGRGKLLIFTEHRDTLNAVRESLSKWGYSTCEIHGGMNPHERKRAQERVMSLMARERESPEMAPGASARRARSGRTGTDAHGSSRRARPAFNRAHRPGPARGDSNRVDPGSKYRSTARCIYA